MSLGREIFDFRPQDIHQRATETGFTELPVLSHHSHRLADPPWHQRDPFDRILVCQALPIPVYLLTTDTMLARYSDLVGMVPLRSSPP